MRFAGQVFGPAASGGLTPQAAAGNQSLFGGGLMRPYENKGGTLLAMGHKLADNVDGLAGNGITGNGARTMGHGGVGGGGIPIGVEQLEDLYTDGADTSNGSYDPATRAFYPGV